MGVKTVKPDWFDDSVILCTTVGSEAHGPTHGDDHDEMAVFVEPPTEKIGLQEFDSFMYRTAWERTGTSVNTEAQPRSQQGDTDYTAYSLGKFFRLMINGNPSICVPLWTHEDLIIEDSYYGQQLIWFGRRAVHNKLTVKKFLGYANGQKQRLLGQLGQKNVKRPELEEAYGFDTKYAYHILRLLIQGQELLDTGDIQLPMKQVWIDFLLGVRQGAYTLSDVLNHVDDFERTLEFSLTHTDIPDGPDLREANKFVTDLYIAHWQDFSLV